jgi:prophage maintenance system killer protein/DNA-binding Lrp family transcriptional regulator
MNKNEITIFKSKTGEVKLNVDFRYDTIWATQKQIAEIFDVQQPAIAKHIKNVLADDELDKYEVYSKMEYTAADGKTYLTGFYNLDMILSVGYRVNSRKAVAFRRWASKILKEYILKGVATNQNRLTELNKIIEIVSRSEIDEVSGVAGVLASYTRALHILSDYDENKLAKPRGKKSKWQLTYGEARAFLNTIEFGKQNANFARERSESFKGILATIYQTFGGAELYPTVQEKAANLLYLIVKDHPFFDGNKRSAAALFVYFLDRNKVLRDKSDQQIIANNALAAITLVAALSKPAEKDQIVLLIMNLLYESR